MGTANTICSDWRWEYDDGDGGSHIESAHNDLSDPDSWLDTNICWRALLYNSGGKDETDGYRLEYSTDGESSWDPVTTSSDYVRSASSGNFTDGDSTSQELGSGTFDEGYWDDDGSIASYTLAQGQESEHEFCFQFRSADCPGNTINLRIAFDGGADLDGYTYSNPSCTFTVGDVQVTPAAAVAVGAIVDPGVQLTTITLTPGVAEAIAATVDPAVLYGSITLTPGVAEALAALVDPDIVLGSVSATPAEAIAVAAGVDPAVQEGGDLQVTPAQAVALAAAVDPAVVYGSITLTPAVAAALATTIDPAVILNSVSITPAQAIALALAIDPNVLDGSGAELLVRALNLINLGVGGRR